MHVFVIIALLHLPNTVSVQQLCCRHGPYVWGWYRKCLLQLKTFVPGSPYSLPSFFFYLIYSYMKDQAGLPQAVKQVRQFPFLRGKMGFRVLHYNTLWTYRESLFLGITSCTGKQQQNGKPLSSVVTPEGVPMQGGVFSKVPHRGHQPWNS